MSFRTTSAKVAFEKINEQTTVSFQEMTSDFDLFETAVADYDGIILQVLFPNGEAGYPKFQLLKNDITLAYPTSYLSNSDGLTDLTLTEVIELVNACINEINLAYKNIEKSGSDNFISQEPEEMDYHEHLDYWVCKCKNFEKMEGFMACDPNGNLIGPIGASYCRCERCGRVIHAQSHTIIGINPNPKRGRF